MTFHVANSAGDGIGACRLLLRGELLDRLELGRLLGRKSRGSSALICRSLSRPRSCAGTGAAGRPHPRPGRRMFPFRAGGETAGPLHLLSVYPRTRRAARGCAVRRGRPGGATAAAARISTRSAGETSRYSPAALSAIVLGGVDVSAAGVDDGKDVSRPGGPGAGPRRPASRRPRSECRGRERCPAPWPARCGCP